MKNLKGFFAGMITMLLIVCLAGSAFATTGKVTKELEYRNLSVSIEAKSWICETLRAMLVEPFMFSGTNYLPVRALAESLGLEVAWDGNTNTVVLTTPASEKATYITRTGSKYHNDPHCNGGTYWEVPLSTAISMGLEPCEKCVK